MYVLNYLINSPLSLSMYFSVQVSIHSTLSMCVINTYTFIFPSYSTHLYIVISIGSYTRKEREEDPFGEGEKERSDAIRWCHECHNTCTMRMAIVVISMSNRLIDDVWEWLRYVSYVPRHDALKMNIVTQNMRQDFSSLWYMMEYMVVHGIHYIVMYIY